MNHKQEYFHHVILGFNVNENDHEYYKPVAMHFPITDENSNVEFQNISKKILKTTNGNNNNISFYYLPSNGKDWKSFISDNPYFSNIKEPISDVKKFLDAIIPNNISSYDIANIILDAEKDNNCTNLRLQKLLYLVFQDYVKRTNNPLFNDSKFLPWKLGPINDNVYSKYKEFKRKKINNSKIEESNAELKINAHSNYKEIFRSIYEITDKYKNVSTDKLVDIVHKNDSTWTKTKNEGLETIPTEYIKNCKY